MYPDFSEWPWTAIPFRTVSTIAVLERRVVPDVWLEILALVGHSSALELVEYAYYWEVIE